MVRDRKSHWFRRFRETYTIFLIYKPPCFVSYIAAINLLTWFCLYFHRLWTNHELITKSKMIRRREYSVHAPSQWETTLHRNVVSHWLGAFTEWSMQMPWQRCKISSARKQNSNLPIVRTLIINRSNFSYLVVSCLCQRSWPLNNMEVCLGPMFGVPLFTPVE